jgi:hypothetical protein
VSARGVDILIWKCQRYVIRNFDKLIRECEKLSSVELFCVWR